MKHKQNSALFGWVVMGMLAVCLFLFLIGTASAQESAGTEPDSTDNTSEESVPNHDEDIWFNFGASLWPKILV